MKMISLANVYTIIPLGIPFSSTIQCAELLLAWLPSHCRMTTSITQLLNYCCSNGRCNAFSFWWWSLLQRMSVKRISSRDRPCPDIRWEKLCLWSWSYDCRIVVIRISLANDCTTDFASRWTMPRMMGTWSQNDRQQNSFGKPMLFNVPIRWASSLMIILSLPDIWKQKFLRKAPF